MIEVYDKKNPGRKPIEVSEQWIAEMELKEPGRFIKKEVPRQITVEKKSPVVVENRVIPPAKKVKSGKP